MKPKHRRLCIILAALTVMGTGAGLILYALRDNLVFFHTPSELTDSSKRRPGAYLRVGGLVERGSVANDGELRHRFRITDTISSLDITYEGILPDLFREGQGLVTEGALQADGTFKAVKVFAKHDENYMPPEVAKSLKDKGVWEHTKEGGDSTWPRK